MKRRLIAKNKRWLQLSFKLRSTAAQSLAIAKSKLVFSSISEVKAYGQYCYQKRMNRQMRMNARQLKKHC